jgi:hypothetical protein
MMSGKFELKLANWGSAIMYDLVTVELLADPDPKTRALILVVSVISIESEYSVEDLVGSLPSSV